MSFFIVIENVYLEDDKKLKEKYIPIAKMVHRSCHDQGYNQTLETMISSMGMGIIKDEDAIEELFKNQNLHEIFTKNDRRHGVKLLSDNQYYYLLIKTPQELFVIQDKYEIENNRWYIMVVFVSILLSIILSYVTMIRKLYPLKKLKDKVKDLANEDFEFDCFRVKSNDEVSQLANEFKKTAKKLQKIKEARNIFIRNMMHELKTPITKGKFLVELDQNEQNNEKLKIVFYRLESLINEFAAIEEVIALNKKSDFKEYFIQDIIDNAIEMMMCDEQNVQINIAKNFKILTNFKLFSIVLKNLIDNGLKYSVDNKVIIEVDENKIVFGNKGDCLSQDLQSYFEPFSKNESNNQDGFGLGLYIVHNILKLNGFELLYSYKDGINLFSIQLNQD